MATTLGHTDSTAAGPTVASVVGNAYLRGPDTPLWATAIGVKWGAAAGTQLYHADNLCPTVALFVDLSFVNPLVSAPPVWSQPLTVDPSAAVEPWVLAHAGARPKDRDAVDTRIVAEVAARQGKIIDTQSQVGGWPTLTVNTRPFVEPVDPGGDDDGDGCTNLEEVLHQAAALVE